MGMSTMAQPNGVAGPCNNNPKQELMKRIVSSSLLNSLFNALSVGEIEWIYEQFFVQLSQTHNNIDEKDVHKKVTQNWVACTIRCDRGNETVKVGRVIPSTENIREENENFNGDTITKIKNKMTMILIAFVEHQPYYQVKYQQYLRRLISHVGDRRKEFDRRIEEGVYDGLLDEEQIEPEDGDDYEDEQENDESGNESIISSSSGTSSCTTPE